jgi:hypothetical protein
MVVHYLNVRTSLSGKTRLRSNIQVQTWFSVTFGEGGFEHGFGTRSSQGWQAGFTALITKSAGEPQTFT